MGEDRSPVIDEPGPQTRLWAVFLGILSLSALAVSAVRLPLSAIMLAAIVFFAVCFEQWKTLRAVSAFPLAAFLLGAAAPLAPSLGQGTLLTLMLSYILALSLFKRLPKAAWAWPVLVLFLGWCAMETGWELDWRTWQLVFEGQDGPGEGGLLNLRHWLAVSPPSHLVALQTAARYVAMIVFFGHFAERPQVRSAFIRGVLIGLPAAALISALSFRHLLPFNLPNQTFFWTMQGRFCSTFTDPNAYAIFCVLAVPLVIDWLSGKRISFWSVAAGLVLSASLASGILSGSRSFLVGMTLYLVLAFAARKPHHSLLAGLGCLAGVICWNGALLLDATLLDRVLPHLPVGVSRILETLSWPSLSKAFFSRSVFFKAALRMWYDNPVAGVGIGHFKDLVPLYLKMTGSEVGSWTDNANSWYLQVLAEMGLIGAAAFCLTILRLKWGPERKVWAYSVFVFAILLIIGPHVEFDEVALLLALVASMCAKVESGARSRFFAGARLGTGALVALAIGVVGSREYLSDTGFFGFERDGAEIFRWTGRAASGRVACSEQSRLGWLDVRPIVPPGLAQGISLRVVSEGVQVHASTLTENAAGPVRIQMPCKEKSRMVEFNLEVENAWTPRKFGFGPDSRVLGVRVYSLPAWATG